MANAGYDVWFGNNRGSKYSRKHVSLNAEKDYAKYFDYSFYELGKYDAPTQIDFVIKKTGHKKISYIGHSQGNSQMFSALSEGHGNLKDKINIFVVLCPITNLYYASASYMDLGYKYYGLLKNTISINSFYEFKGPRYD